MTSFQYLFVVSSYLVRTYSALLKNSKNILEILVHTIEYLNYSNFFSPKAGYFPRHLGRKPMAMTADWWNAKLTLSLSLSPPSFFLFLSCSTWILDINNKSRGWHRELLFIHFIREWGMVTVVLFLVGGQYGVCQTARTFSGSQILNWEECICMWRINSSWLSNF